MLSRLFIKNFALISACELDLRAGLTVLTGETGAGKSMLTDALGLALGGKADAGKIRPECAEATVEATFDIPQNHPAQQLIESFDLSLDEGEISLRRTLPKEGKSRASANGLRVPLPQLQDLATALLERHSQHESQKLFKPSQHAVLLNHFAGITTEAKAVRRAYKTWRETFAELQKNQERLRGQKQEQELLSAYIEELEKLAYLENEEETLATERQQLMSAEHIQEALQNADSGLNDEQQGALSALGLAERSLAQVADKGSEELEELATRLSGQYAELVDVASEVGRMAERFSPDPERLLEVDERLNSIRDLARKHHIMPAELNRHLSGMQQKLAELDNLSDNLQALEEKEQKDRSSFELSCKALTKVRNQAAQRMAPAIEAALKNLHMEKTKFEVRFESLEKTEWTASGAEKVHFYVQTNPGIPAAPLVEAASGGEASRLMLALKQVLYADLPPQTLIFDEIDSGIGGAVASAAGAALADLAKRHQVLVITHQPQVAAHGAQHLKIEKSASDTQTQTSVRVLSAAEREDELARMLAGKEITDEARQAAQSLLKGAA